MKLYFSLFLMAVLCLASCKEDLEVVPYVVNIEDANKYDYSSTHLLFSVSSTKKYIFQKAICNIKPARIRGVLPNINMITSEIRVTVR